MAAPECSGRRTEEAHFKGIEDFELERDALFNILADSRAVGLLGSSSLTALQALHEPISGLANKWSTVQKPL